MSNSVQVGKAHCETIHDSILFMLVFDSRYYIICIHILLVTKAFLHTFCNRRSSSINSIPLVFCRNNFKNQLLKLVTYDFHMTSHHPQWYAFFPSRQFSVHVVQHLFLIPTTTFTAAAALTVTVGCAFLGAGTWWSTRTFFSWHFGFLSFFIFCVVRCEKVCFFFILCGAHRVRSNTCQCRFMYVNDTFIGD